jgi:hypothetical protein
MSVSHAGVFVQTPNLTPISFLNADSANTKKTIVTGGGDGSKIVGIGGTSTETANARLCNVWITRSGTSYLLGTINIPINSGFDGTAPAVSLFNATAMPYLPSDNDGQVYIFIKNGDTLQVSLTTQVASGKEVDVFPIAADF